MKHLTKTIAIFLLIGLARAFGQNALYVQQISTSAIVNVLQAGGANRIGSSGLNSIFNGDTAFIDIKQVGNGNALDFNFTSASNTNLKIYNTGDSNTQGLYINGGSNTFDLEFTGSSNTMVFNSDASNSGTTQANVSHGTYTFTVGGNSNAFNIGTDTGTYNSLNYTVAGNSNVFNILQDGAVSGTSGHNQTVIVDGSSNNVYINQNGTSANSLYYKLTGSSTNTSITQGPTGTTQLNIATTAGITHP